MNIIKAVCKEKHCIYNDNYKRLTFLMVMLITTAIVKSPRFVVMIVVMMIMLVVDKFKGKFMENLIARIKWMMIMVIMIVIDGNSSNNMSKAACYEDAVMMAVLMGMIFLRIDVLMGKVVMKLMMVMSKLRMLQVTLLNIMKISKRK